jgi:hypothetical protein
MIHSVAMYFFCCIIKRSIYAMLMMKREVGSIESASQRAERQKHLHPCTASLNGYLYRFYFEERKQASDSIPTTSQSFREQVSMG